MILLLQVPQMEIIIVLHLALSLVFLPPIAFSMSIQLVHFSLTPSPPQMMTLTGQVQEHLILFLQEMK